MTTKKNQVEAAASFRAGKNIRKKRAAVDEDTREIDIDTRSGNTNALNEIKGTCREASAEHENKSEPRRKLCQGRTLHRLNAVFYPTML